MPKNSNDKACEACELYKAYWFVQAVKAGIDTDIAREMSQAVCTAWQAGYNYAMNHKFSEYEPSLDRRKE